MALTIKEIYNIQTNIIRPESMVFYDMLSIVAKKHALWFLKNEKETDEGSLAESYKTKMHNLSLRVKQKDGSALVNILDSLTMNVANFLNYSDMKNYSDADWSTMAENNISEAFETTCDVTPQEKTAYNALPNAL